MKTIMLKQLWLTTIVSLLLILSSSWVYATQPVMETVLHSFTPVSLDGAAPQSTVLQGLDGSLYGTTWDGGADAAGTVFRLNGDGTGYRKLYNFTNQPDGSSPVGGLDQGVDGNLYGTTYYGGVSNFGSIFKIGTNGNNYSVLWSFTNSPDGANPNCGVVQGADGALYGTTESGGAAGAGTIFKIMPDGSGYSILHSFTNSPDGATSFAALIQGMDGRLYGTTSGGGGAAGTVFDINTNGGGYSILYRFVFFPDGDSPQGALTQASNGMLYGMTDIGGTNGYGSIFMISTNGNDYSRLYCFSNSPDGANPGYASLMQAADGALYGTTEWGGSSNAGTVFKISLDGSGYAIVHNFGAPGDGTHPVAGTAGRGSGVFYGTTQSGSTNGFGTVYQVAYLPDLQISLSAPLVTLTLSGFPGESCQIQASTNFSNWMEVDSLELTNGSGQWSDPALFPYRFYRVAIP